VTVDGGGCGCAEEHAVLCCGEPMKSEPGTAA